MNYRNITEVGQLYESGVIQRPTIVERLKGEDDEKDLKESPKNNPEHFDVVYAGKIKEYKNIFKHIHIHTIIF